MSETIAWRAPLPSLFPLQTSGTAANEFVQAFKGTDGKEINIRHDKRAPGAADNRAALFKAIDEANDDVGNRPLNSLVLSPGRFVPQRREVYGRANNESPMAQGSIRLEDGTLVKISDIAKEAERTGTLSPGAPIVLDARIDDIPDDPWAKGLKEEAKKSGRAIIVGSYDVSKPGLYTLHPDGKVSFQANKSIESLIGLRAGGPDAVRPRYVLFKEGDNDHRHPINPNDITQDAANNCNPLAIAAQLAATNPQVLRRIIKETKPGEEWVVTTRKGPITVTRAMLEQNQAEGSPIDMGDRVGDEQEVWPAVFAAAARQIFPKINVDGVATDKAALELIPPDPLRTPSQNDRISAHKTGALYKNPEKSIDGGKLRPEMFTAASIQKELNLGHVVLAATIGPLKFDEKGISVATRIPEQDEAYLDKLHKISEKLELFHTVAVVGADPVKKTITVFTSRGQSHPGDGSGYFTLTEDQFKEAFEMLSLRGGPHSGEAPFPTAPRIPNFNQLRETINK